MSTARDELTVADEPSDAATAFASMSRKLALVVAAQEGFAIRLQEMHGRDYTDDLARIHEQQAEFVKAIRILAYRPAMELTVEGIAERIEQAGKDVRASDHQALTAAREGFAYALQAVKGVVATALTASAQRKWMGIAAGAGTMLGMILFAILPGAIARSMPESWLWPEQRAAHAMRRNEWDAGIRLLQVSDPDRWRAEQQAIALMKANEAAIKECWMRSLKGKEPVGCSISVEGRGS
jgi:hypothetical protein